MDDLTILHLSDLHFEDSGSIPLKLFNSLLEDIENELSFSKNVVIAITGDLIDKAQYEFENLALSFFEDLQKTLQKIGVEVKGVFIVPGNHDKERSYALSLLPDDLTSLNKEFFETYGAVIRRSYKKYVNLRNKILDIFGIKAQNVFKNQNSTCFVSSIIIGNQKYNFVGLDTAWSAKGDNDRRKLKIGEYQVNYLENQFKSIESKKNNITIALAHHPLNWLTGDEEDFVRNFLIGQKGIDANIFLCGHSHQRDIINWSNNRHTLVTLSSGIGWSDSFSSDHSDVHSYAIYVIQPSMNALNVYVRSTNDGGQFVPDLRIYTKEDNRKYNKIILPLISEKIQSYFELGRLKNRSPYVLFLSTDLVSKTRKFVESINYVVNHASKMISDDYVEIRDIKQMGYEKDLNDYKNEFFLCFLQSICEYLAQEITEQFVTQEHELIRFHMRYRCKKKQLTQKNLFPFYYKKLCLSFSDANKEINLIPNLSDMEWGQLIKDAYETKRPLIYSINPENVNKTTVWTDFLTAIPSFFENNFKLENNLNNKEKTFPFLTFGVSINSESLKEVLYCFDYYRIDLLLGFLIRRYIHAIEIDLKNFVNSDIVNN